MGWGSRLFRRWGSFAPHPAASRLLWHSASMSTVSVAGPQEPTDLRIAARSARGVLEASSKTSMLVGVPCAADGSHGGQ